MATNLIREKLKKIVEDMAAEAGISVEAMERQIMASAMMFSCGPTCISVDEFKALVAGKDLLPERAAHVAGCRNCTAIDKTLKGEKD